VSFAEVAIVGAGISGLATAWYLKQYGIGSVLIEKAPRVGGLIKTDQYAGCTLEAGPDSFIATKPAVIELANELGDLATQIIASNDQNRRIFIVRSDKLIPLPAGMSMMVPGRLLPALRSKLFSVETKGRFIVEQFRRPQKRSMDISIGKLISDHFGDELLKYVADPLLVGVYGGQTANLSAESVLPRFMTYERRYGSLIRGVRLEGLGGSQTPLFRSFRNGMETLIDLLASSADIVHKEVTSVERDHKKWVVHFGTESMTADKLVLACPAHVCAQLLEPTAIELATELAGIPYSSAILVTLLYDRLKVSHSLNGFGFLVPEPERRTIAAATWINTKFPSRVAPGLVAIRGFIVAADALRLSAVEDGDLASLVANDLLHFMQIEAPPLHFVVYRWPDSMPQFVVGHKLRQERVAACLTGYPSLALAGNAYDGVGIPDCVRLARQAAQRLARN